MSNDEIWGCLTPRERIVRTMRATGASLDKIAKHIDRSKTTVAGILKRSERRLLAAAEYIDKNTAHSKDAGRMLELLLPHINQIKELTK